MTWIWEITVYPASLAPSLLKLLGSAISSLLPEQGEHSPSSVPVKCCLQMPHWWVLVLGLLSLCGGQGSLTGVEHLWQSVIEGQPVGGWACLSAFLSSDISSSASRLLNTGQALSARWEVGVSGSTSSLVILKKLPVLQGVPYWAVLWMVHVSSPILCFLSWICFWGTGGVMCWLTDATKCVLSHLVVSDSLRPHVP